LFIFTISWSNMEQSIYMLKDGLSKRNRIRKEKVLQKKIHN
jgi:hypothetical protein